ncbi:MAG: citrate (Si)-synthase [Gammaproteobacteria bacterium TMED119]|nr:MAG: citrate (Si)-synthase [Gammaproteobacteria bacterium TMED119]RCL44671.1 MAG: citrate synthase [Candidatus Thioglobus sp.]
MSSQSNKTVTVTDNATGKQVELPVLTGTDGPDTIDIRAVYRELGYFTFDPGFVSTASCESQITFIDGGEGRLAYRGYPIEQLANHSNFDETCYLLMHGELPTAAQLDEYSSSIKQHKRVDDKLKSMFAAFAHNAHPMAMMIAAVGALAASHNDEVDVHDAHSRELAMHRMIAKMPVLASWCYRHAQQLPFNEPNPELDYTGDFLHMLFSQSDAPAPTATMVRAMDLILILHADHEQNASTSTVRLAGSSETSPFAALSAGISSLWGPAHGGANEAVIHMLNEIVTSGQDLSHYIARAKDKEDRFRLMGFGHRVYKNYDPRAKIIRQICHDLLAEMGADNPNQPLLKTAMDLEKIALEDDYFIQRKLYPNVDFYSGIIFQAMGIPLSLFTVIFALARTVGWLTHWNEMMSDPSNRIGRPRQLYTGYTERDYSAIKDR